MNKVNLLELLSYIPPSELDYTEWVEVGMALKHEGYSCEDWDKWSMEDHRYKSGECQKKWDSFNGSGNIVTGGTIVNMAQERGFTFGNKEYRALDWDDVIKDDYVIIDKNWVEGIEIEESGLTPAQQLIKYLQTLFDSTDNVGYVVETWVDEKGKHLPKKGPCDRTAGQLIEAINKADGDVGAVLGDYNKEAGAWIRFNPLDGKGVKNENVTDFKYALVESDSIPIDKQNAIIRELELPVACLVHSGKKSIHAIVKVDAGSYEEYRKRVDYLYNICKKNGLIVDTQNRNPSRLSRMPGVMRNGVMQALIDTNIGKSSWKEWVEWIEAVNDELPDVENLGDFTEDNLPSLADALIDGVLRQGHKMLIAGPSKAGKSYALINLCIAIAEGKKWFHWQCNKGKVLYVNLELDRASCLHRFHDVYNALKFPMDNISNIDIWNLRGKAVPMDKLAPKLIRRALKKRYIAIVIDPIYKVITGDENSADQMAHFTNQFDKVCTELSSAVIYCHHHSKGSQGNKRSMDRASGSGVFARDPDALIDMVELELTEGIKTLLGSRAVAAHINRYIINKNPAYHFGNVGQDDVLSENKMRYHALQCLDYISKIELEKELKEVSESTNRVTAWRLEGTLREFPTFKPVDLFFKYPIHTSENAEVLKDLNPEGDVPSWKKTKKEKEESEEKRRNKLEIAYSNLELEGNEKITVQMLAEEMGVSKRTVFRHLDNTKGFLREGKEGTEMVVTRKEVVKN